MKKFIKRSLVILMIALLLLTGGTAKNLYEQNQVQQTVIHTQQQSMEHMQKVIDYQEVKLKINNSRIQYQNMQLKDVHKQVETKVKVMNADDVRTELKSLNHIDLKPSIWGIVLGSIITTYEATKNVIGVR